MATIGSTLRLVEKQFVRTGLTDIHIGDSVKMRIKVTEGDKARVHPFEGTIIRKAGKGASATFTVRKVSFGEGIERTFPVHSPIIAKMDVINKTKVNRSKLYYLRDAAGKKS